MSDTPFIYGEAEMAAALGLPVRLLQKNRTKKMAAGADWDLNGNRVAYSSAGAGQALQLLAYELENNPIGLPELLEKSRLRAEGELPEFNGTIKRFWPNPHLVDFELPDGSVARVRVQTTKNLRPGMTLPLTRTADGTFELAGRLPRTVLAGRRGDARGA